jgi:hypothetical protein
MLNEKILVREIAEPRSLAQEIARELSIAYSAKGD